MVQQKSWTLTKSRRFDMLMAPHLDYDDPKYAAGAAEILRRHDNAEAEANITSAVRDFLILTKLAKNDEISEENPP